MADRKEDRKWIFYVCGWCSTKVLYAKNEEPIVPCPACGWHHKAKKYNDVPSEIKIDLANPSIT